MADKNVRIAVRICEEGGKILKSWTFLAINQAWCTYAQLFKDILSGLYDLRLACKSYTVKEVATSPSINNDTLVKGTLDTDIIQIVHDFGYRFFTVVVEHEANCETCRPKTNSNPPQRAFDVMMAAARAAVGNDLPKIKDDPKNNKEKLSNEVLRFFQEKECKFPNSVGVKATSFLARLTDLLFYIDGQYGKIETVLATTIRVPLVFKTRLSGFNTPETSKHRKRHLQNISEGQLEKYTLLVREIMQGLKCLDEMPWAEIKIQIIKLLEVVEAYCLHLKKQRKRTNLASNTPRSELERATNVTVVKIKRGSPIHPGLVSLDRELSQKEPFAPISVREYLQTHDRRRVHNLVEELCRGLSTKCVYYVHHVGGSQPSLHFVWRVDDQADEGDLIRRCTDTILYLEESAPVFERRITKRQFLQAYGFVADAVALRAIFKELTRDQSGPCNLSQKEIDNRFEHAMLCEDPSILVDLRHLPPKEKKDSFQEFFAETELYLSEDVGVAVQERRHGEQLYLAKAVSLPDLHKRVKERVPEGTNIPSVQWLRYQFQPRHPRCNSAKYYKARMNIKMMVQKRQVRVNHVDAHYCASAWRYMRDFAVHHRDLVCLASMDDKHKVKCGEPSYPLAAAERGKQVIVGPNQVMAVGDHDFSKSTITPSVNLLIDVPTSIEGSFYRGDVFVGIKDSILQPSSPLRHASELRNLLKSREDIPPILLIYSDGGPDHRCTYMSVKTSLMALFLDLDLDVLVALRTAPSNSWANPVERMMSIVNIGLQGIGVMRKKGSDDFEKAMAPASSMKDVREKLKTEELKEEWKECIERPIDLLNNQMKRLSLKDRPFQTFSPSTDEEIAELWGKCLEIDDQLQREHLQAKDVRNKEKLQAFLSHCCVEGHYCFQIRKCGAVDCNICRPLRDERCKDVGSLPFPVLDNEGLHYKPFIEVYKTDTKDARPSKDIRPKANRKKLPFSPSMQHCKNTDMMVQCVECDKWRLIFSKKKLRAAQKEQLGDLLEDIDYTCGFQFDDLDMPRGLEVFIKDHDCNDPIEKLYFACDYEACCIFCGEYLHGVEQDDDFYPQCDDCDEAPIRKRRLV